MPSNKSALLRYKIIDRRIRNKYQSFPSIEDLRQACEDELFNSTGERVSRSTIEKDIRAMREDEVLTSVSGNTYFQRFSIGDSKNLQ
ncbi:MAG: hypothetical protein IPO39_10870 [Bacteroidetes bacterium]|nr:hypothetical protein [Bacteroidota bacterium]